MKRRDCVWLLIREVMKWRASYELAERCQLDDDILDANLLTPSLFAFFLLLLSSVSTLLPRFFFCYDDHSRHSMRKLHYNDQLYNSFLLGLCYFEIDLI